MKWKYIRASSLDDAVDQGDELFLRGEADIIIAEGDDSDTGRRMRQQGILVFSKDGRGVVAAPPYMLDWVIEELEEQGDDFFE